MDEEINMNKVKIDRNLRNTDIGRHLITMYGEVANFKPNIIVELGVRSGVSTKILAEVAKIYNARLISVDKGDCAKACDWDKWEFIKADSVEYGEEFYYKAEPYDVLFIDTYHSKPQVLKELKAWIKSANDDTLFIFHDTNPAWHKNIKIAEDIGSVLDGVNEFFGLNIAKDGNHDSVYYDDKYIYYITHHDYFEGMTYIRRTKL